jgi:hypothetical protein
MVFRCSHGGTPLALQAFMRTRGTYGAVALASALALTGSATSRARLSTTERDASHTIARGETSCASVLQEVDRIVLAPPQGEDANAAHGRLRNAADAADCRAQISARALQAPCGAGLGIVTSALFGHRATAPSEVVPHVARAVRELEHGDGACVQAVLPSVQYVTKVDPGLVDAVSALRRFPSVNARSARLLTLGSLSFVARSARDHALQSAIEETLLGELRARPTDDVAIDAVGNAGCERCQASLGPARGSADAWVRGAAATSDRFIPGATAANRMCAALGDAASHVRAEAAWALSFGTSAMETRRACLTHTVRSDADLSVRLSAARSLTVLASVSPSVARSLEGLHDESLPTEVRVLILEHLTSATPPIVQETALGPLVAKGT